MSRAANAGGYEITSYECGDYELDHLIPSRGLIRPPAGISTPVESIHSDDTAESPQSSDQVWVNT
jgi:hypothetical protein